MKKIYNGTPEKSGIYKITNTLNGKFYYGSCSSFRTRWLCHESSLLRGKHGNPKLQSDFKKCLAKEGNDDFLLFQIIEVIEGDIELRLFAEQKLLDQYYDGGKQCYNVKKYVRTSEGQIFSHTPEETRRRLSVASKGRTSGMKGKKQTEESKRKMSEAMKGKNNPMYGKTGKNSPNYGKPCSLETRRKMRKAQKGRKLSEETKKKIKESWIKRRARQLTKNN